MGKEVGLRRGGVRGRLDQDGALHPRSLHSGKGGKTGNRKVVRQGQVGREAICREQTQKRPHRGSNPLGPQSCSLLRAWERHPGTCQLQHGLGCCARDV